MKALLLSFLALAACELAAQAAAADEAPAHEVRFVQSGDGRIELHADRGACQGQARRAAYVPLAGDAVGGCWITRGTVVAVVFFDGDIANVPVAVLKKAQTV